MKNNKFKAILIFIVILGCIFTLVGCSKEQKTYEKAVEHVNNKNINEAISLFSELPSDYCPKSSHLTPAEWIYELETEYNSGFEGEWEGFGTSSIGTTSEIKLSINYFISEYSGVNFYYSMYTWSPGGVMVSQNGDLKLVDSNNAYFVNSDSSNSVYYQLEKNSEGNIILLFKGEIVSVLYPAYD